MHASCLRQTSARAFYRKRYTPGVWSRVHKVDRIRPQPNGGAIILIEDERGVAQMSRTPSLSTLIAVARVLDAKQVLEAKYAGKGEVRYAPAATPPGFLSDAIARAGGHIADRGGDKVVQPAQPASVAALVDVAFSELAHSLRGNVGVSDLATTLKMIEADRRKKQLDRDTDPSYWPAVFELAALAGELARNRGGRWIEVTEMPVPFAMKFPETGEIARPHQRAIQIVEGNDVEEPAPKPAV